MKSVDASGTKSGRPAPRPVPKMPPVPSDSSDCTSWYPSLSGSANGCSQMSTRVWMCEKFR